MKKITLFVCALATAVATFAAQGSSKLIEASKARQASVESTQITKEYAPLFKSVEAKEAVAKTDTVYIPYDVPGAFHYGVNKNGIFYYTPANYVTSYAPGLVFYNDYNFKSTWLVNGTAVAQDTALAFRLPYIGEFNGVTPVMQTPKLVVSDTLEYYFPDYEYGALGIAEFEAAVKEPLPDYKGIINAPAYITPITKCAIYTENPNGWYAPFDYGTYGASTGGSYWYGTKLVNNYISDSANVYYMDTTAVLIANRGLMYISDVKLGIYTRGNTPGDMFPNDSTDFIRLTLYPISATNGFPEWENPIASAVAGRKDVTGTGWNGILTFNFLEVDEITGNFDTVPAIVEGPFWAVLDGYNEGSCNFGFLSDDEMTTSPSTYFFFTNPADGQLKVTKKYRTPANLDLSFNAYMPAVANAPEEVYFAKDAELTKTITLNTNTWAEDYEIDAPEWIDIDAETVYDGQSHGYAVKLTIKVEASEEVRDGEVIITDFTGFEFGFTVKQNQNDPQGIENVSFKNDNKLYNVLGIEVGEDYKGVVIRNGEKFVK